VNRERFEELARAYGGEIARWPAELRDEASLLAAAEPAFARAVLSEEARLDAALDDLPRAPASAGLFEAIVAAAPTSRGRRRSGLWGWWIAPLGAVLAATAAAGVIVGVQIGVENARSAEASAQSVADLDVSAVSAEVG
jgi:hypothetical protein